MIDRVGNYRITDEIGSGGMAVVYKGIQESLGRTVAIKALKTSVSEDPSAVARFEREALSVASFQHENIITLYDFFKERGALFMVMEYVEGIDLYDLLERCRPLPVDVAVIMALQVARALDYAHFRGVIHRDVKPANVMISNSGEVKLTDFGIARTEQSDLTEMGVGLGTPAYMSPEQVIGDRLDHRSDLWSLGVVLYQMVTGRKPFVEDDERTVMQRIRLEDPEWPRKLNPGIPKELERIITRCMQKKPEERYASSQELIVGLEQFLATHVAQNYRARLVRFLREQEVISADLTSATLHPALIGEYLTRRNRARAKWPLRTSAIAGALLLGGVAVGALGYAGISGRSGTTAKQAAATPCANAVAAPASEGQLHVLAYPWARVEVDGKLLATTPFQTPLTLKAGRHKVRLTNPYFEPVERDVAIAAGRITTLTEALTRAKGVADGGAP
ncbi:MAG: serine/threonine protein kinase [Deltaproteobacteria bacterium]|nr:serine/threonine protein kinase [Deltaproteobacteria bacterium]